ncbi:hypothetical protein G1K75_09535 [Tenacibaculum finnmarkense]|uniref:hypothetical protein n=1 Tax=Tenacibaculum finnmarkense TaxID=2781243 RepID=UPI001EFC2A1A|nr:hypothetical protein [Tenacibaculum finnmarkense]MCG8805897.1 hypothetical protein [Tenacibaculum finnmarkense]MCG8838595.1 hypothetical protein [Tenacibaculum dicentrarchi]
MKIVEIRQNGNIFEVDKEPSFLGKLVGLVKRTDKYKDTGFMYEYFENTRAYVTQDGEILGASHSMTKVLENWRRRF